MWRKLSEIKDLDVFSITEKPEEITDTGKDDRVSEKFDSLKAELIKLREAEAQARVFSEYEHRSLREAVEALSDDKDYMKGLMVEYLLCIADGLEAGVRAGEAISGVEIQIWLDGIRVVHQRVMELLAKLGVHPIHSEGKLFDPYLHSIVAVESSRDAEDNTVLEEKRRGYLNGDRLIRCAEVIVNRQIGETDTQDDDQT